MTASNHRQRIDVASPGGVLVLPIIGFALALVLVVAGISRPALLAGVYLLKQDIPILCVMTAAAVLIARMSTTQRWQRELRVSRMTGIAGATLLVAFCLAGRRLVMLGHDLSRDESMTSLAMQQIMSGELVTPVPHEWQPFGRALLPIFYNDLVAPDLAWASGYRPVNSAFHAVVGITTGIPALTNPVLLAVGLFALWSVARRLWPDRPDTVVVTVLLAATSSQLIATAMTSYAMTGYFALNLVWLALFLRSDWIGMMGALVVAFLATGLHQIHFHPMFAAPFLLWLVVRGQWWATAAYLAGYSAIGLFWWMLYPQIIVDLAGGAASASTSDPSLWAYISGRIGRLFEFSPAMWLANLARFAAWQNAALLPLAFLAVPLLRSEYRSREGLVPPLIGACVVGLMLMVNQGHGWGYRYLHGLIGCFCLLAGYGWCRLVPSRGPARAWAAIKMSCALSIVTIIPVQLAMAQTFVAPHARLERAARAASVDVVLVDTAGGFYAQDLVQNDPDFRQRPKVMDLALVPPAALTELCETKSVLLIDGRHYRAVGMRELPLAAEVEKELALRRSILSQLDCASPLNL